MAQTLIHLAQTLSDWLIMAHNGFISAAFTASANSTQIADILVSHNVTESDIDGLVYVCTDCASIAVAPSRFDADMHIVENDIVCCDSETTFYPRF